MKAYCEPIRPAEWHEPEAEWLWSEVPELQAHSERELVQALNMALAEVGAKNRSVTVDRSLEDLFKHHADKWETETAHLSSTSQIMMHPSYQAVLGMGDEVVPLLLRDMQQNRRSWFGALSYITKENPINPSDAGKMQRMIDVWVRWGRAKGLL